MKSNKVKKLKVTPSEQNIEANKINKIKNNMLLPEDDSEIDFSNEAPQHSFTYSSLSGMTRKELYNSFRTGFANTHYGKNSTKNKEINKDSNKRLINL